MPSPRAGAPRRPDPEPLELDDTRLIAAGTAAWMLALLGLVAAELAGRGGHGWWMGMCGWGVGLGLVGLRVVARRKAADRRRPR